MINEKTTLLHVAFINEDRKTLMFRTPAGFYVFPSHTITDKFNERKSNEYVQTIRDKIMPGADLIGEPILLRKRIEEKVSDLIFYTQGVKGDLMVNKPHPYESYIWAEKRLTFFQRPSPQTSLTLEELSNKDLIGEIKRI